MKKNGTYESYLRLTNGDEEKVYNDQIEKIPYPGDQFKVALDFRAYLELKLISFLENVAKAQFRTEAPRNSI